MTDASAALRKRPRQQRSQETVDRILDTAARLFDELGYRSTTTNHVAEAAGVSIGSLYQYFPNKDSLLVGLGDRHLDEALPALFAIAADVRRDDLDLPAAFRRLFGAALEVNRGSRLHQLLWTAPRTPELAERFAGAEELMVAEIAWHLERAGWSGDRLARRARLIVLTVEAAIHDAALAAEPDVLADELVGMCLAS